MVEPLGFEPREVLPSPVFKTGAFDQLSQSSIYKEGGGATQIRTGDSSFAGCGLTTWRWHQNRVTVVPEAGLEPARPKRARDFKSLASTNFATRARDELFLNRQFHYLK